MGLFNWLFGSSEEPTEEWRILTDADVQEMEFNAQFWKEQSLFSQRYVVAQSAAWEHEAIARGAFDFLSAARATAEGIRQGLGEAAKEETKKALPSAKRQVKSYAQSLRKRAG